MENVLPFRKYLDQDDVPYATINCADYGVPQTRRRVFAGGVKNHSIEDLFQPTHSKDQWIAIKDALPDLEGEIDEIVKINTGGYGESGSRRAKSVDTDLDQPVKTICGGGGGGGAPSVRVETEYQFIKIRSLSLVETAILQGFPSDYLIPYEKKGDAWVIIGNAVCPPISQHMFENLKGLIS